MKLKSAFLCIVLLCVCSLHINAQDTEPVFVVKKPLDTARSTFTYKGKPINPEVLLALLPGMEMDDTIRPKRVNLKDSLYVGDIDTSNKYFVSAYVPVVFFSDTSWEWIGYRVVGKTADNKFVLDVKYKGNATGSNVTFAYIFVFKVEGDMLIKVAWYEAEPTNSNQAVYLKGNEIINGSFKYKIPN